LRIDKETAMKIHVLKKGNTHAKHSDPCPFMIEVPPEAAKK
jgi:hypothetical protein